MILKWSSSSSPKVNIIADVGDCIGTGDILNIVNGHIIRAENERMEKSTVLGMGEGRRGRPCVCAGWMG